MVGLGRRAVAAMKLSGIGIGQKRDPDLNLTNHVAARVDVSSVFLEPPEQTRIRTLLARSLKTSVSTNQPIFAPAEFLPPGR